MGPIAIHLERIELEMHMNVCESHIYKSYPNPLRDNELKHFWN